MGRSISPFDPSSAPEKFSDDLVVRDPNSPYRYKPFVRGDTLFQKEWIEDAAGKVVAELTVPVSWVVGSGNATRSYLINVNGFVTEAPLTWYVGKQKWDLSPGYTQVNERFSRPINLECMTCHNSLPSYSDYTINHYTKVPLGISCERCHGPSSVHVERQLAGLDVTSAEVVNPANLARPLQLGVCQQCHLTGLTSFRPGEDPTTFRPGQPLSSNRDVFEAVTTEDSANTFGISSHGSRLALSECFVKSSMTCTTCHDPHVPVAETPSFNSVCASCHSSPSATLCARDVQTESMRISGNCTSCHMQKGGTSDIPHVSFTDHWIRAKLPESAPVSAESINRVRLEPMALVKVSPPQDGEPLGRAELAAAVSYFELYETLHQHPQYLNEVVTQSGAGFEAGATNPAARRALGKALIEQSKFADAVRTLQTAVVEDSADATNWFWLGSARRGSGDLSGAVDAYGRAIKIQPLFLDALASRADVFLSMNRVDEAIRDYRQVVEQDSLHHPRVWNNLGFVLLQSGQMQDAIPPLESAVLVDPLLLEARVNLGTAYLSAGRGPEAIAQFETVLSFDPESVPALGNLGIAFRRAGDVEKAREMFDRLLEVSPNDPNARRLLGELDRTTGGTR